MIFSVNDRRSLQLHMSVVYSRKLNLMYTKICYKAERSVDSSTYTVNRIKIISMWE